MEESSWMTGQIFYVMRRFDYDTVFPLEIQEPHEYPARVCRKPEIKAWHQRNDL